MVGGKLDVGKKNECESEEETNKKESVYREKEKEKRVKKRRKLKRMGSGKVIKKVIYLINHILITMRKFTCSWMVNATSYFFY